MELTTCNIGYCEMSAALFVQSARKGYDSKDFIEKLMNSEMAVYLYNKEYTQMWLSPNYIIESLEQEVEIKKGITWPEDLLSWIGYLFECWNLTYMQDTAKDMIKQAPVDTLTLVYQGLHVMSFEDAILELKNIYKENRRAVQERYESYVLAEIMEAAVIAETDGCMPQRSGRKDAATP